MSHPAPSEIPERSSVLILHSTYLSGWASGENRVVRDDERLLREAGHDVVAWTPAPSPEASRMRLGSKSIWSPDASRHVRALIAQHRPDIVHCHNLFPMMSPSVIRAATDVGAKLVMTLHNYRMSCLPATFIRDGEICELCLGHIPWRGVVYRCYRGSLPGSAALATSLSLHRAIRTFDKISLFLPVSRFVRNEHIRAGFPSARMMTKPNFCWPTSRREGVGSYFLYAGRLASEKDVGTLLEAWHSVDERLIVVGDGPDRRRLEAIAPPNVEFLGTVEPEGVNALLQDARALLVPTRCNEGGPRAVIESYAAGVPVIATALGALPELIDHGVTGLLVPAGSAGAWVDAARSLLDSHTATRLGQAAYARWAEIHSPEKGLLALETAYRTARGRDQSAHFA